MTRDFPPVSRGGISTACLGLATTLHARGFRNAVMSFDGWRPRRNDAPSSPEIQVADTETGWVGRLSHPQQCASARLWGQSLIPQVVLLHEPLLLEEARRIIEGTTARLVVMLHVFHPAMARVRGVVGETRSAVASREACEEADCIFSVSSEATHSILHEWPSLAGKTETLPLGILAPAQTASSIREAGLVTNLARFDYVKGTDLLFEMLNLACAMDPKLSFEVGGGLPESPKLHRRWLNKWQKLASQTALDRVHYLGWLKAKEAAVLLQRAVVCLIPSRYETFGLSGLEAMAAGAVVLASGAGGLSTLVRHHENGWVVRSGDPKDWAEAMICLSQDPTLRARLQARALEEVQDQWTWRSRGRDYAQALKALLA